MEGAARVLDIAGNFDSYNESATPLEADARAIANDWMMVGRDMSAAIAQFEEELNTKYAE